MSTQSNAMPESAVGSQVAIPTVISPARRMYWLMRRELWEGRSIYLAPLAVAALILLGFLISMIHFAGKMRAALALDPMQQHEITMRPYHFAELLIMGTTFIVAVFYCLDALYGERRDRSILFWKSLPVSDLATVLSKASIPLVVLPLVTFAITVAMQWLMLLAGSAVVLASGQSVAMLWTNLSFVRMSLMLLYHLLTAHALWPAPIYCWLLLVSGWARRAPFLWAVLPVVVVAGVENLAFHTWHFAALVGGRFMGDAPTVARTSPDMFPTDPMTHIAPGSFLGSPGLWIGLAIAAAFLVAAVRVRRYQGPI